MGKKWEGPFEHILRTYDLKSLLIKNCPTTVSKWNIRTIWFCMSAHRLPVLIWGISVFFRLLQERNEMMDNQHRKVLSPESNLHHSHCANITCIGTTQLIFHPTPSFWATQNTSNSFLPFAFESLPHRTSLNHFLWRRALCLMIPEVLLSRAIMTLVGSPMATSSLENKGGSCAHHEK